MGEKQSEIWKLFRVCLVAGAPQKVLLATYVRKYRSITEYSQRILLESVTDHLILIRPQSN
jgi:hypothetical protein